MGGAQLLLAGLVRAPRLQGPRLQETACVVLVKLALDKCQLLDCNIGDRDSRLTGLVTQTPSRFSSVNLCACLPLFTLFYTCFLFSAKKKKKKKKKEWVSTQRIFFFFFFFFFSYRGSL